MGLDLSKPKYGLITYPSKKPAKPHKCHPPGEFMRFIHWIMGDPIIEHSVWRCSGCMQAWEYQMHKMHDATEFAVMIVDALIWMPIPIECWLDHGGRR